VLDGISFGRRTDKNVKGLLCGSHMTRSGVPAKFVSKTSTYIIVPLPLITHATLPITKNQLLDTHSSIHYIIYYYSIHTWYFCDKQIVHELLGWLVLGQDRREVTEVRLYSLVVPPEVTLHRL